MNFGYLFLIYPVINLQLPENITKSQKHVMKHNKTKTRRIMKTGC